VPELRLKKPTAVVMAQVDPRCALLGAYPRVHEDEAGDPVVFASVKKRRGGRLTELAPGVVNSRVEGHGRSKQRLERHRARDVCHAPQAVSLDDGQRGEDGQCRAVKPGREQRPAAGRELLGIGLRKVEERGDEEGQEPEPRREREAHLRQEPARAGPGGGERALRRALGRERLRKTPENAREQESNADLHGCHQDRVVVRSRVGR